MTYEEHSVDWQRELRHTWPLLAVQSGPAVATAPLRADIAGDALRIGVDQARIRHLLVPLAGGHPIEDGRSAHVKLTTRSLVIEGEERTYVDLYCLRDDLYDLFNDIIADVLSNADGADDGAELCARTLRRWRELLRHVPAALGERAARGLFAELSVLKDLLDIDADLPLPRVWTGPLRSPHDFELTGHSLEVKAIGDGRPVVEVHGVDQLAEGPGKDLHLIVMRLIEDGGGRSIADLVSELLDIVPSRHDLLDLVAEAGYSPASTDAATLRPYAVVETLVLPVTDDFPRIVRASFHGGVLPDPIEELTYRVDLTTRLPTALRGDSVDRLFREGVAGL